MGMVEVKADALEASFEAIERDHDDVAVLREEVAALTRRIEAPVVRPVLSGAKAERSLFVESYLRRGVEAGVELKAMVGTSEAAGGYAVPEEIDAAIDRALTAISPIRAIANVVKVGSAGYRKLVTTGGTPSGWVSEVAARPETGTPNFVEIAPPFGELYANPAASQAMLDDAAFDVEAWLASEIATEFARAEGAAFVAGDGVNKPKGFLRQSDFGLGDGTRPFGTVQFLTSGAAGGFAASNPQDRLIDLVQALRPPYRQGAVFVMNSATAARIRKFKTSDGAFLWQPGLVANQPDTSARLSGGRGGGHAGLRGGLAVDRVRQFPGGVSDRGADGDADPARSVHAQAVRAFLRDQAGGWAGLQFEAIKLMKFAV
jgi:HK97 family phage major capsid protein